MTTDAELRAIVAEEIRRSEDHISTQIALLTKTMETHLGDRFAHGWDHQLIERSQNTIGEWTKWRQGVDQFRWYVTGGLTLLALEIPVVAAILVAILKR